ncbi:molecular chaperone [Pseudomonas sp.]|uniref:molecular chaperone n=1 Tax=Pseudomonas sp. TaxID=306 RepID=UPI0028B01743|nr:molecular chaperone [Pseudomonas sp.]
MNTIFHRLSLLLALLSPTAVQAAPELSIGGLYDYIDGGRSTLLKRVRNGGDTTAFVKVSAAELVYDEQGKAREVDLEALPIEQRGLVVSPARLIVPARGLQSVRFLYRGSRSQERYFRVRFIPVLPEVDDGFSLDQAQAEAYRDSLKAGVNLLAGYGSILFVRPADEQYATRTSVHADTLRVENGGNSTVVLDHFRVCRTVDGQCGPATKHHVLPGRQRTFEGRAGGIFQFELQEGRQRQQKTVQG